ncbi:ATP-binding protein [Anatilimnocola sp. NA78]|uniref:ATP-binding protein n=1 Tax=Anatilimnocola sp. NA78 TaxID=3415683 RepID=UPI003CE47E25
MQAIPNNSVDLTSCDREPIHIPGAIQPHGMLVVVQHGTLTIRRISDNVQSLLGQSPEELIGQSIDRLCATPADALQLASLGHDFTTAKPVYLFTLSLRNSDHRWDVIAHAQSECIILEFEPSQNPSGLDTSDLYRRIQSSLVRLEEAHSVQEMSEICAEQVKSLTGFDRVMVYRFDREWNGEVVAEQLRSDLEPFLGLHYPASDIPQQARELYTRNWLRFITDRDYRPSLITPLSGPETKQPLDLSFSVLRSVSPIHLEYLRNMGVCASMSISIIRGGRLWGLIACHHYSPRYVPYDVRKACELLGHFMSLHFINAEEREFEAERSQMKRTTSQLIQNLTAAEDAAAALLESTPNLLSLVPAIGAAVIKGTHCFRIGHAPSQTEVQNLGNWLLDEGGDTFATDELRKHFGSGILTAVAAGLLAVVVNRSQRFVVLWFRPEQVRLVNWAGNPEKLDQTAAEPNRLSPRGSFALWQQTVRGRSLPWTENEIAAANSLRDSIVQLMLRRAEELAVNADDMRLASVEREKALESERAARVEAERLNRMKDEFVATLSHELRTPLNAILGWTQLLRMNNTNLGQEASQAIDVIERNARAQAVMIEDLLEISRIVAGKIRLDLQDVDVAAVVLSAIEAVAPVAHSKGVRLDKLIDPLRGAKTSADPNRLKQIVWNLLTNAVKFTPKGGKAQVVLRKVESHIELTIADSGIGISADFLPHVFDRYRQADGTFSRSQGGLGLGLAIVRNLVELHGGNVSAHSQGEGMGATFVVTLPFVPLRPEQLGSVESSNHDASAGEPSLLQGLRVLVVDDELDAREMLKHLLSSRGCEVTTAERAAIALDLRKTKPFDVVISDIGMPQVDGYEFMRQWRQAESIDKAPRLPAIALTAYARSEDRRKALMAGFHSHVTKPVEVEELLAVLASVANRV